MTIFELFVSVTIFISTATGDVGGNIYIYIYIYTYI